jgi:hypothetical protein
MNETGFLTSAIRNPQSEIRLGCFCDFAGFNAGGADFHAARATLRQGHANRLQVGVEPSRRTVVCVRDVIAKLR